MKTSTTRGSARRFGVADGLTRRLASPSTVGRLERAADRSWAWAAHETLVESFIASYHEAPEELVLDFDCTDDAVHGCQEGRFFHGYYDHYCFSAALCLLRRSAAGQLPEAVEHSIKPSSLGDPGLAGEATAPGLARCAPHGAGRFRLLPPQDAVVVRAPRGWLHRRAGQERAHGNDQAARGMALAAAAYERTGEKQRVFADLELRRPELV